MVDLARSVVSNVRIVRAPAVDFEELRPVRRSSLFHGFVCESLLGQHARNRALLCTSYPPPLEATQTRQRGQFVLCTGKR